MPFVLAVWGFQISPKSAQKNTRSLPLDSVLAKFAWVIHLRIWSHLPPQPSPDMKAATIAKMTSPMPTAFFQAPLALLIIGSSGEPSSLNSCSGYSFRARKIFP